MSEGRSLISFEKLPPRDGALDRIQVDKDVREAMAVLERRLRDRAQTYSARGFQPVGDVDFAHGGDSTIIGSLRIARG